MRRLRRFKTGRVLEGPWDGACRGRETSSLLVVLCPGRNINNAEWRKFRPGAKAKGNRNKEPAHYSGSEGVAEGSVKRKVVPRLGSLV